MGDNLVDYTLNPQFRGEDAFHCVMIDGRLFAVGRVTVEVTTGEKLIYPPLISGE